MDPGRTPAARSAPGSRSTPKPSRATRRERLNDSDAKDLFGSLITEYQEDMDRPFGIRDIPVLQMGIRFSRPDHPTFPMVLAILSGLLMERFDAQGDIADVEEAVELQERLVDLLPDGDRSLPGVLSKLGNALWLRFECSGDEDDVDRVVEVRERAVDVTPPNDPRLPERLYKLGESLLVRFQLFDDVSDIDKAISHHQRAVDLCPAGHPLLHRFTNYLGNSYLRRYERTGDPSDMAAAIAFQRRAVSLAPDAAKRDLPILLNSLGCTLMKEFERTSHMPLIEEAVLVLHQAVGGDGGDALSKDDPNHPGVLYNLGSALLDRFARTEDLNDLQDAISARERAVERCTAAGHPELPAFLGGLGSALARRYEIDGEHRSDIDRAIEVQRRALALTPPENEPKRSGFMTILGNSLLRRFDRLGDTADADEAVALQREAVALTPEDHPELPRRLQNLGGALAKRSGGADADAVEEAIAVHERAVALMPVEHAVLPGFFNNLGARWYDKYLLPSGTESDLDASISYWRSSATATTGLAVTKLDGAKHWARQLHKHRPHSPELLEAYDCAVGLVALVAGLERPIAGRYVHISRSSTPAMEAASAALTLGRPDKALEWLEQGRCLVWRQLSTLRTPLDELGVCDPELARRVADVSRDLESAGSNRAGIHGEASVARRIPLQDQARVHVELAERWEALLGEVRAVPGFEGFLRPMACADITRHLPPTGYVVVVNVDERRCDALVLSASMGEPLHIPLPNFTLGKAQKYKRELKTELERNALRARGSEEQVTREAHEGDSGERGARLVRAAKAKTMSLEDILKELWKEVVQPIFAALKLERVDPSASQQLPRIWWCPTGPLSFLPIHAAGIYEADSSESVMDYAVSSYTPTVTALTDRVKASNKRPINHSVSGLFLTNQPNAPGALPIPGTTVEVQTIYSQLTPHEDAGMRLLKVEGSDLTVEQCLEHMGSYSSVHLACHAFQNAEDPLRSRFLFHRGALDLHTIMQRRQHGAAEVDLAFLSACQTSAGAELLADEAVHLAAGMLAAGYRRVVATMWSIADEHAVKVAEDFYEYLLRHRTGGEEGRGAVDFDGEGSAEALHFAVRGLRERLGGGESERALRTWVPYVHFGL